MSLIPRSFYLDDIFDGFDRNVRSNDMKCDIYEKDDKYCIDMDVPGYDKSEIKIECDNGMLVVTAEKNKESNFESENKNYIRRERVYGKVSRTFNFSDIDEENITASFENGILKLSIPKSKRNESKRYININ